jgi:hypothetical protein
LSAHTARAEFDGPVADTSTGVAARFLVQVGAVCDRST